MANTKIEIDLKDEVGLAFTSGSLQGSNSTYQYPVPGFNTGYFSDKNYAYFGFNYWVLDGSHELLVFDRYTTEVWKPVDPQSTYITAADFIDPMYVNNGYEGAYIRADNTSKNIDMTITFEDDNTTVTGLYIEFNKYSNDYSTAMTIKLYGPSAVLINTYNVTPTGPEFTWTNPGTTTGIAKIVLTSTQGNRPLQQYVTSYDKQMISKIQVFPLACLRLDDESIISANALKEMSFIADTLPIGTLSFEILLSAKDRDVLDDLSIVNSLHHGQKIRAYQIVNGVDTLFGYYYLDDWEHSGEGSITIRANDIIGTLEDSPIDEIFIPRMTDEMTFHTKLQDIMNVSTLIDVSYPVATYQIYGKIAAGTRRQAVQQLLFAAGYTLILDVKPNNPNDLTYGEHNQIRIGCYDYAETGITRLGGLGGVAHTITTAELLEEQLINKKKAINTITTKAAYTAASPDPVITTSSLDSYTTTGTIPNRWVHYKYMITNVPESSVSVYRTPGLAGVGDWYIEERTNTYIKIAENNSQGTPSNHFAITATTGDANLMIENETVSIYNSETIDQEGLSINIDSNTLITPSGAPKLAQKIFDFNNNTNKYIYKFKMKTTPAIHVGDQVTVETIYGGSLKGYIEKMDVDISGGYVTEITMTGKKV